MLSTSVNLSSKQYNCIVLPRFASVILYFLRLLAMHVFKSFFFARNGKNRRKTAKSTLHWNKFKNMPQPTYNIFASILILVFLQIFLFLLYWRMCFHLTWSSNGNFLFVIEKSRWKKWRFGYWRRDEHLCAQNCYLKINLECLNGNKNDWRKELSRDCNLFGIVDIIRLKPTEMHVECKPTD